MRQSARLGALLALAAGCGTAETPAPRTPTPFASGAGATAPSTGGTGGAPFVPTPPNGAGSGGATQIGMQPAPIGGAGATAGAAASAGAGAGAGGQAAQGGSTSMDPDPPDPPVTCPMVAALSPGDSNETIDVGGTSRRYIRHVPPGYTGDEPVPLLIDWHPLFSTGSAHRASSGYAQVADREGFIVLFPDGIDNAWNIGPCCTFSRDVDDLGFAQAMVDTLKSEACIDPKRVYAAGYSMGGGMSHYLACEKADVFAAVAPAAFDLLEENTCAPSRPISVLAFRGTADFIVPYAGGASTPPNGVNTTIHFRGAVGTLAEWARVDGCTDSAADLGGGCQGHRQCEAGVEVTLCTATGGGHVTGDAERGWEMLSSHALP